MKKFFLIFIAFLLLFSCAAKESTSVTKSNIDAPEQITYEEQDINALEKEALALEENKEETQKESDKATGTVIGYLLYLLEHIRF